MSELICAVSTLPICILHFRLSRYITLPLGSPFEFHILVQIPISKWYFYASKRSIFYDTGCLSFKTAYFIQKCTGWGVHLFRRFCKLFSENSSGSWAVLELPCSPSKQGELLENILQNLRNKWPPNPVALSGCLRQRSFE